MNADSLEANLDYTPHALKFGSSGRRGEVIHLSQLEVYINALAELEYLQSRSPGQGGIVPGEEFFFAFDLRPSSTSFVAEQQGRGEIAQAIQSAIHAAGMKPVNLGALPTPALTCYALERRRGSMMITGSHIPFDRNGYKTNSAKTELLKEDEARINARVEQVRERLYSQPYHESPFNRRGLFKTGHQELPPEIDAAREAYLRRYTDFFAGHSLAGKRLMVYQHSSVGRDLLLTLLQRLGAEAIPAGRSDTFVPIDTENVDEDQLDEIQGLADAAWAAHGRLDGIVSTDGDSDRPLILGVEPRGEKTDAGCGRVRFFGGDLVGMIVAEYLGADAVVVPISCNDAVDRGPLRDLVEPKTRIGSPYVIAGMEKARQKGRQAVCGWEANGGFLTGSDLACHGRVLRALPTRDAMLPILGVLFSSAKHGLPIPALFERLPKRFSRAALLRQFPRAASLGLVAALSPTDPRINEVDFDRKRVSFFDADRRELPPAEADLMTDVRARLQRLFDALPAFGAIVRFNYTDGVRIGFDNGEVVHVRPSGNADELRIYAVADTQARADAIAKLGVTEPDGLLRRLAREVRA